MSMQIKRGTTDGWQLGPELIDFGKLSINGNDSTIHCEGTTARIYLGTTSAADFNNNGIKNTGIWLVRLGELVLSEGRYAINIQSSTVDKDMNNINLPWGILVQNKVYEQVLGDVDKTGTAIGLGSIPGGNLRNTVFFTVTDDISGTISLAATWNADYWLANSVDPTATNIHVSIRKVDDYGVLLPGQIGCEYFDEHGSSAIKIGKHNDANSVSKWNELKYVGQVLPPVMYGDELPETGVVGQIFYKRVSAVSEISDGDEAIVPDETGDAGGDTGNNEGTGGDVGEVGTE